MAPQIPEKIPCTTPIEFVQELRAAHQALDQDETEDNWEKMGLALKRLAAVTKGGAYKLESEFPAGMKGLADEIVRCMASERTRLSGCAVDLLMTFIPRLGARFDNLVPLFLPNILKLCTRTNKVFVTRGQTCLNEIVLNNRLPSILPYLLEAVKDKSQSLRSIAADAVVQFLDAWRKYETAEWKVKRIEDVENVIRTTARDSNPEVRKISRKIFESYKKSFPERVNDFVSPLTPITKKYLEISTSSNSIATIAEPSKSSKPEANTKPKALVAVAPPPPLPSAAPKPKPNLALAPRRPQLPAAQSCTVPLSAGLSSTASNSSRPAPSHTRSISASAINFPQTTDTIAARQQPRMPMAPPRNPDPASRPVLSRPHSSNSSHHYQPPSKPAPLNRPAPLPVRTRVVSTSRPQPSRELFRPTSAQNSNKVIQGDTPSQPKTAAQLAREEVLRGKPQRRILVPAPPPPAPTAPSVPTMRRVPSASTLRGAGGGFVPKRETKERRDLTAPTASQRAKVRDKPLVKGFMPKKHAKVDAMDEVVKVAVAVPLPDSPKLEAVRLDEVVTPVVSAIPQEIPSLALAEAGETTDRPNATSQNPSIEPPLVDSGEHDSCGQDALAPQFAHGKMGGEADERLVEASDKVDDKAKGKEKDDRERIALAEVIVNVNLMNSGVDVAVAS